MRNLESFLKTIYEHAERDYPHECCGLVLGLSRKPGTLTRRLSCRNAQESYSLTHPEKFCRSDREAYLIDPAQLLTIQKEIRRTGERIAFIYHSHIDRPAVFSGLDRALACPNGHPDDPGVGHLIVSVQSGRADGHRVFWWDEQKKEYAA